MGYYVVHFQNRWIGEIRIVSVSTSKNANRFGLSRNGRLLPEVGCKSTVRHKLVPSNILNISQIFGRIYLLWSNDRPPPCLFAGMLEWTVFTFSPRIKYVYYGQAPLTFVSDIWTEAIACFLFIFHVRFSPIFACLLISGTIRFIEFDEYEKKLHRPTRIFKS